MENEEKLTELITVKVSPAMADDLTEVAGGARKRAEYIRQLIAQDVEAKRSSTQQAKARSRILSITDDLGEDIALNALEKAARAEARRRGK